MTSFTQFADFTHDSVSVIPAVKGTLVALYATGSSAIEATAADIAKYKNAGAGVVLIDQTPSLSLFAAGLADIADVENGAGTFGACATAVLARQSHGWQSTIYISQASYEALIGEFSAQVNQSLVGFGIANWSDSLAAAETALNANAHWSYVQYGDPASNPSTVVPGTSVTLKECNADIDVAKAAFANQFLPNTPPPPPPVAMAAPKSLSSTPFHAVDLGWSAVAGATSGYDVQIVNKAGTKEVFRATVAGTSIHGVVLPAGSYSWHVATLATAGKSTSPWSSSEPIVLS